MGWYVISPHTLLSTQLLIHAALIHVSKRVLYLFRGYFLLTSYYCVCFVLKPSAISVLMFRDYLWCLMGHVALVVITGTVILLPYHTVQVTTIHSKCSAVVWLNDKVSVYWYQCWPPERSACCMWSNIPVNLVGTQSRDSSHKAI